MMAALGVGAYLAAAAVPIALALLFWTLAKRARHGWVAKVAYLPTLLIFEFYMIGLVFYAADDTGDGPPGLGLAILPLIPILIVSVLCFYGAVIRKWLIDRATRH